MEHLEDIISSVPTYGLVIRCVLCEKMDVATAHLSGSRERSEIKLPEKWKYCISHDAERISPICNHCLEAKFVLENTP